MSFAARLEAELEQLKQDGVYKRPELPEAPQAPRTKMQGRGEVIILSSNNYLGLCNAPEVVAGGKRASISSVPARARCDSSAEPSRFTASSSRRSPGSLAVSRHSHT